jgi:hypothetical protein
LTRKRDFAAGVYLSEAQNPIAAPPLHTVYSILIHIGKGEGGGEFNRKIEGQQFTKQGRKYQYD